MGRNLTEPGASDAINLGLDGAVILENDDCRVIQFSGESGEGVMTVYTVFDGVYLIYNDFHAHRCASGKPPFSAVLSIEHCREGRVEVKLENGAYTYLETGDLSIDERLHETNEGRFPLNHYHGITMLFQKGVAEESLRKAMPQFEFDLAGLARKFCCGRPCVVHGDPGVEHLLYQLYRMPGHVKKDYFKVKIVEMLLYLSGMEPDEHRVDRPFFYAGHVETVRAIHDLITSDLSITYTAEELARRFSISMTTLKRCFKSTYGSPIYAYLKRCRMERAAELLITERRLLISEVAAMVGYESQSKFTAVFHQMLGETPMMYRKTHGLGDSN